MIVNERVAPGRKSRSPENRRPVQERFHTYDYITKPIVDESLLLNAMEKWIAAGRNGTICSSVVRVGWGWFGYSVLMCWVQSTSVLEFNLL